MTDPAVAPAPEHANADFMPLDGWDYVELWVGNAKQAAYFYERAFGFALTAYAGPETGVRDRASYVLEQGSIRLVLTSALREDHDVARHCGRHGDGVAQLRLPLRLLRDGDQDTVPEGQGAGVHVDRRSEDRGEVVHVGSFRGVRSDCLPGVTRPDK